MHVEKARVIVTKSLELILFGITAAAVAEIYLAEVLEEVTLILCELCRDGIGDEQDRMTFESIDLKKVPLIPRANDVIAGIMIDPADAALMQLFAYSSKIAVQHTEVIREVKPGVEAEIDGGVNPGFGKSVRPLFYFVEYLFLRPLEVFEGGPPAGCPVGDERGSGLYADGRSMRRGGRRY